MKKCQPLLQGCGDLGQGPRSLDIVLGQNDRTEIVIMVIQYLMFGKFFSIQHEANSRSSFMASA